MARLRILEPERIQQALVWAAVTSEAPQDHLGKDMLAGDMIRFCLGCKLMDPVQHGGCFLPRDSACHPPIVPDPRRAQLIIPCAPGR